MVSVFQLLQRLLNMGGTGNVFSNSFQREAHELFAGSRTDLMKFNSINASTVGWMKMPQPPLFMGATNGEQEFKAGCGTHRTLKTMSDCPHQFPARLTQRLLALLVLLIALFVYLFQTRSHYLESRLPLPVTCCDLRHVPPTTPDPIAWSLKETRILFQ